MTVAASDLPWQELDHDLRAFIARRVRNQADVDDLVQRVLLQIVKGLGTLRECRASSRVGVSHGPQRHRGPLPIRRRGRELATGDTADLESAPAAGPPAPFDEDEDTALRELATCLAPMLGQLPPTYQEAVRIVDLQGVTQVEAAQRAGVSLSGMKSRVQRGRRQLRAMLEACCRIDLDRRGGISAYAARNSAGCGCDRCGGG